MADDSWKQRLDPFLAARITRRVELWRHQPTTTGQGGEGNPYPGPAYQSAAPCLIVVKGSAKESIDGREAMVTRATCRFPVNYGFRLRDRIVWVDENNQRHNLTVDGINDRIATAPPQFSHLTLCDVTAYEIV